MPRPTVFLSLMALVSYSIALVNLTTTGCADASGLQKCLDDETITTLACIHEADGSQIAILACGCTDYIRKYNCYSSHCWNRVNECEYQSYIVEYLALCPIAKLPIPYFPAPANASDSCSCNVGLVDLAILSNEIQLGACSANGNGLDPGANVQKDQGCKCCTLSGALSSMYALCPDTDPNLIGLSAIQEAATLADTSFDTCSPYLSKFNCVSDLGYSQIPGNTFYNPSNLHLTGTSTLFNVPGTVTAPASGAAFTYTNGADSQVYTITAANFNADGKRGGSGNSPPAATVGASTSSGVKIDITRPFLVITSVFYLAVTL